MPLYLFKDGDKVSNLDDSITKKICEVAGNVKPEDIFDYVYTYLHSPNYRKKYSEFLKSDFPRVPYPQNKESFWKAVELGSELRNIHLFKSAVLKGLITTFPESGSDTVEKISYKNNRVYINDTQYWEGVSKAVWEFYIGGYQPAQKYLKDRKGKKLTSSEFENYEKMIVALSETIKIMEEIDKVI